MPHSNRQEKTLYFKSMFHEDQVSEANYQKLTLTTELKKSFFRGCWELTESLQGWRTDTEANFPGSSLNTPRQSQPAGETGSAVADPLSPGEGPPCRCKCPLPSVIPGTCPSITEGDHPATNN